MVLFISTCEFDATNTPNAFQHVPNTFQQGRKTSFRCCLIMSIASVLRPSSTHKRRTNGLRPPPCRLCVDSTIAAGEIRNEATNTRWNTRFRWDKVDLWGWLVTVVCNFLNCFWGSFVYISPHSYFDIEPSRAETEVNIWGYSHNDFLYRNKDWLVVDDHCQQSIISQRRNICKRTSLDSPNFSSIIARILRVWLAYITWRVRMPTFVLFCFHDVWQVCFSSLVTRGLSATHAHESTWILRLFMVLPDRAGTPCGCYWSKGMPSSCVEQCHLFNMNIRF